MPGPRKINPGRNWHNDKESDYALKIAQIKFVLEYSDFLLKRKDGRDLLNKLKSIRSYYYANKYLSPAQLNEIERIYELTIEEYGNVKDKTGTVKAVRNQKNKWGINLKV